MGLLLAAFIAGPAGGMTKANFGGGKWIGSG